MGAVYLNTDLNLRARFDLAPLNSELVDAGLAHIFVRRWHGIWESTFESDHVHGHPSEAISRMLDAVAGLTPSGLALWHACIARRFNVGYRCSDNPYAWTDMHWTHTTWQFTAHLLQKMASANASFVVTIYRQPELRGGNGVKDEP